MVITADAIYLGGGKIASPGWLHYAADGTLAGVGEGIPPGKADRHLRGLVLGGLVNAHCHLELSHLAGKIQPGMGMAGFIQEVQAKRAQMADMLDQSIQDAIRTMYQNGIRAVGDICNSDNTLAAKTSGPEMHYHNFVEVFGVNPGRAEEIFMAGLALVEKFGVNASLTLHAPYSISEALRDMVWQYAMARGWTQSIHLLESKEELQLFSSLDGPLMDMLRKFGLPFPGHSAHSPTQFIIPSLLPDIKVLLVHMTEAQESDVQWVKEMLPQGAYAVLCPRANQYIHGTLPPVDLLEREGLKPCIGTDSLASNWGLDIWEEMRVLQQAEGTPTEKLLLWAVDHGQEALGLPAHALLPTVGHPFSWIQLEEFDVQNPVIPTSRTIHFQIK